MLDRMRVGIDIGGTKIAAALVRADGRVAARAETPTPQGPHAILDAAAALATALLARAADDADGAADAAHPAGAGALRGAQRTAGAGATHSGTGPPWGDPHGGPAWRDQIVGVGTAGTVDPRDGSIRYATDSISGWTGTKVAQELAARLGRAVVVDNDVNAAALGEAWAGAGRGYRDLLLVAVGTGVGAGLIRDGRVERGSQGAAGEIAHLPTPGAQDLPCGCGRTGHLESLASGTGLAHAYRRARTREVEALAAWPTQVPGRSFSAATATGSRATGREVAELAAQGDPVAREVVTAAGTALGRALAGLVALLDPAAVVVAGGAAPSLMDSVAAAYADELLPAWAQVPLVPASLGTDAVAVGAARLAWGCDEPV